MRTAIVRSALVLVAALFVAPPAEAQSKAFKITGNGIAFDGLPLPGQPARDHGILGNATHLGRHVGLGSVETVSVDLSQLPTAGIITGTFQSGRPYEFLAANGDKLVCDYGQSGGETTGTYTLVVVDVTEGGDLVVEAEFIAEFAPNDQSTGRFAGVTGSWVMYAYTEPFVLGSDDPIAYGWEGRGRLTFPRGR